MYIAKNKSVAARALGDEVIIMSSANATLYTLNGVGRAIWESADGRTTLAKIIDHKVCDEFEVSRDEALRDAEQFVGELAAQGLLVTSEEPITD